MPPLFSLHTPPACVRQLPPAGRIQPRRALARLPGKSQQPQSSWWRSFYQLSFASSHQTSRFKPSQCRPSKKPSHQSGLPSRGRPSLWTCDHPRRSLRSPLALGLSLLTWNARSLIRHQADFLHLLQVQDIDVAAVQECHLFHDQTRLGPYELTQGHHPDGHVVTIFVHQRLSFSALDLNLPPDLGLEVAGVNLRTANGWLPIIGVYAIPDNRLGARVPPHAWQSLQAAAPPGSIYMGDFNSHHPAWGSPSASGRGSRLWAWIEASDLVLLNDGSPTRIGNPGQRDTHLDLMLVPSHLAPSATWQVLPDARGSDHLPCTALLNLDATNSLRHRVFPSTREWIMKDSSKWADYEAQVATLCSDLLTLPPDKQTYAQFLDALRSAADSSFPRRRQDSPNSQHVPKTWWTPACATAVSDRNDALATYLNSRSAANFEAWRQARLSASDVIRRAKRDNWNKFIEELQPTADMPTLWRLQRRHTGRRPPNPSPGDWLEDFLHLYSPDSAPAAPPPPFQDPTADADAPDLAALFTLEELDHALHQVRDSAPGMDGITATMLSHLPPEGKQVLLRLLNNFWCSADFPDSWHQQLLLPILKPGKPPESAASYRPIALASIIYKLFERLIKPRLEWWMEANNLLDPQQYGFRKGSSTSDALGLLSATVALATAQGQYAAALFVDIAGAYPSVRPALLLQRLHEAGAPPRILNCLRSALLHQELHAVHQGQRIGPRFSDSGLPQGWVLSPLLYIFDKRNLCKNLPPGIIAIQYADDIVLIAVAPTPQEAASLLQQGLQLLASRLRADGAALSPSKSSWIFLTSKPVPGHPAPLQVQGDVVPYSTTVKYLGININKQGWAAHISYIKARCAQRINFLKSIAGVKWGCHPGLLITAFKTVVRPVLEYGAGIVDPGNKKNWEALRKCCSAGLRVCLAAMPSSPIPSLQVEAADWPITQRLEYLTDRLLIRWRSRPQHPALASLQALMQDNQPVPRFRARPPLLLRRLCALPPPDPHPPADFHTWPCYALPHRQWCQPLDIHLFFPPAPVSECPSEGDLGRTFSALREGHWLDRHIISTDGSRGEGHAGVEVGAAWYDATTLQVGLYRLPPRTSVFLAEAYAILQALRHAETNHIINPLILSDSRSVLSALQGANPNASTPHEVVAARRLILELTARGSDVQLAWCPAHRGIPPNEAADAAALIARAEINVTPLRLPPSAYYAEQRLSHRAAWQAAWNNARDVGRHLHRLQPIIPSRPWFSKISAPKKTISTLIRWRIGHCATPAHLFRVTEQENDICPRCGHSPADLHHLVQDCTFSDRLQLETILQDQNLHTDLLFILSNPSLSAPAVTAFLQHNPHLRF